METEEDNGIGRDVGNALITQCLLLRKVISDIVTLLKQIMYWLISLWKTTENIADFCKTFSLFVPHVYKKH